MAKTTPTPKDKAVEFRGQEENYPESNLQASPPGCFDTSTKPVRLLDEEKIVGGFGRDSTKWKSMNEVWDKSVLFKESKMNALPEFQGEQNEFWSFVTISWEMRDSIPKDHFLWENITPIADDEEGLKRYQVTVFIDSEWRNVVVDETIPVDGTQTHYPFFRTATDEVVIWPCILFKTISFLKVVYGEAKSNPFNIFNKWFQVESSSQPKFESVPVDIDWTSIRRPKKKRFYFKSWEEFHEQKTNCDPELVDAFIELENEAIRLNHELTNETETQPDLACSGSESSLKKKKKKGVLPFNQFAYDSALVAYIENLSASHEYLFQPRKFLDVLRIGDQPLNLTCFIQTESDLDTETPTNLIPTAMLAQSKWKTFQGSLPANSTYSIMELSGNKLCLKGLLQENDSAPKESCFRVATEMFDESAYSVFLLEREHSQATLHDHWQWCEQGLWTRDPHSKCTSLVLTPQEDQLVDSTQVLIQLCTDSTEGINIPELKITDCSILDDFLSNIEKASIVLQGRSGIYSVLVDLVPGCLYALSLEAVGGCSVRIICVDGSCVPSFQPLLDSWQGFGKRFLHSEDFSSPEVAAGDWHVITRYAVKPANESLAYLTIDLDDAKLMEFLEVLQVDPVSGQFSQINHISKENGQWATAASNRPYDLVVLLRAPLSSCLPATQVQFRYGCSLSPIAFDRIETGSPSLYKGTYLANKNRLLFRDYLIDAPNAISVRLEVSGVETVKLQIVAQKEGGMSGNVLSNDTLIFETYDSELHYIPQDIPNGTKLVLQAVCGDKAPTARTPYWDPQQVPPSDSSIDVESISKNEIKWQLFTLGTSTNQLKFRRENAWEDAVTAIQSSWTGRRESGNKYRNMIVNNECSSDLPPHSQDLFAFMQSVTGILQEKFSAETGLRVRRSPMPRSRDEEMFLDRFIPKYNTTTDAMKVEFEKHRIECEDWETSTTRSFQVDFSKIKN